MLSDKAKKIFEMKYAKNVEEDWIKACYRVAKYVASAEEDDETRDDMEEVFLNLLYNRVFLPGGRVFANAGTEIKNLMNCFVLPVEDSRDGIYSTLKDAAEIFAHGGGVGYNFSDLREEGADIKSTGGKASGPLSFMSLFDQTGEVIQQASRRGAQMGILNIDHPDVEKFIDFKSTLNKRNRRIIENYIQNLGFTPEIKSTWMDFSIAKLRSVLEDDQLSHFNISVLLTDDFMRAAVENKDWELKSITTGKTVKTIKARHLLNRIAKMAWESGDPGFLFYDRTNEDNIVPYLGDLKATNPCVTGDTRIITVFDGVKPIKDLVENEQTLVYTWNPETKLPEVSFMSNIRKTRENVDILEIEFDSGLKVKCTPDHNFYAFRGYKVQAKDLEVGQAVRAYSMSIEDKDGHLRVHGWKDGKARHQYVARMVWEYFFGPIDGDWILHHKDFDKLNNHVENLELISNSMHSSIHFPYRDFPKFHDRTKEEMVDILFPKNHKVISIKPAGKADVYNGVVDGTHAYIIADDEPRAGVMSGIVSANCGEVPLLPNEPCCLGSINLHSMYDKQFMNVDISKLEYTVRNAIRFLDNVQTLSELPLEKINLHSKNLRRLGLGVMGWADLLAEMEISYDSDDAILLARKLSWLISYFAWLESINLATERGAFEWYERDKVNLNPVKRVLHYKGPKLSMDEVNKIGLRNVSVTSIAPTGTIAMLADVNSSIEPFFALYYKRNITEGVGTTAKDAIYELNPILFKKLKEKEYSNDDLESIKTHIKRHGTLSNCDLIDDKLKEIFKTSHEIPWTRHIEMQSAWQNFVSNAVSKTINCPASSTVKDIYNIIISMWNNNLKGGTIYRDKSKSFQILELPDDKL